MVITTIGVNFSFYEDKEKYMIIDTSGMNRMIIITGSMIKSYENAVIVYQNNSQKQKWNNILESINYKGKIFYLQVENKIYKEDVSKLKEIMEKMTECVTEVKTN